MNSPTLLKFISTALIPVGHTMYVYGGGWDESDTKGGTSSVHIGEMPVWKTFFSLQTSAYDYKRYLHCTTLGLDCTGYIGWCIYNLLNTKSGEDGFVFPSAVLGCRLMEKGLGTVTKCKNPEHRPGDIFFSEKHHHAYISLGKCSDTSVLLLHSSPPGVMLSGTQTENGSEGEAQSLATSFMHKHYPHWSIKYPQSNRSKDYLFDYSRFRFYKSIVPDPEKISCSTPSQILQLLK